MKAYNDWMIEEWCGESGGHLVPLAIVPLWDAEMLRPWRCAETPNAAATRCASARFLRHPWGLPSIHSLRFWDPFFQACQDTNTVVNMHIGSSSRMPAMSPDAPVAVAATSFQQLDGEFV